MSSQASAYVEYRCPACGADLRHRLVDDEARVGKFECCGCRAWVDDGPNGYVVAEKPPPGELVEALVEDEP